jgi:flavin-dependent dehydrogenase
MVSDSFDVAVIGAGPAGLATAIVAAERGLEVIVLERRAFPPDKACGEGLLPPGVAALERLGVVRYLPAGGSRRFCGIRFVNENGSAAEVPLPGAGGLGVRRTVLVEAMAARASALGVTIRDRCAVDDVERSGSTATVRSAGGALAVRLVVAADGLHSPVRRAAGLARPPVRRRRFALRRHFAVQPWTDLVEVHADARGEAVVTPISDAAVNVNVVWEHGDVAHPSFASLLAGFPALQARLAGAEPLSTVVGAGPMACGARRRTDTRLVLMGDAAGFIDSISADGLSIAFNSALLLGAELPHVIAGEASIRSLRPYERAARRLFAGYWTVTHGLLWIARHPQVRRPLIRYLAGHDRICGAMMDGAMRLMVSAAAS